MEFGNYITQEYSILKNIFSYLSSKELRVCSLVCREWKRMADKFIEYHVECIHGKREELESLQEINKLINPALILHFLNSTSVSTESLDRKILKTYGSENVPFYHVVSSRSLFTPCKQGKISNIPEVELSETGHVLAFFPHVPGLTIGCYEFDKNSKILPEMIEPLLNAKGVLLLGGSSNSSVSACNKIVHYLYFTDRLRTKLRKERPCLAGGLLLRLFRVAPTGERILSPVTAISFCGDNVTVHCDINKTSNFETFFKKLSQNAGPKPPGSDRYAFIFNCIGRYTAVEPGNEDEIAVFRKYFPGIPYFGFWSYGEFYLPDSRSKYPLGTKKIRADRHLSFLNSASASFMIVTVTIPQSRPS